jgi:hypothetical protein
MVGRSSDNHVTASRYRALRSVLLKVGAALRVGISTCVTAVRYDLPTALVICYFLAF